MEIEIDPKMEDNIFPPRLRMLYGIIMIILGIATMIATYKYVIPIGSISLIGGGLILIFWRKWMCMVRRTILRYANKEIK